MSWHIFCLLQYYVDFNNYAGSTVYVVSENQAVFFEISATMGRFLRVQEACYGPCEEDLPEKNCTDNLIIWQDSPENKVYQEENCVFIDGDMRTVDAFLYDLFGL